LSNIIQLTDGEIRDNDPYLSPDGYFIAWESFVNSAGAIRTYDMAKGKVKFVSSSWNINLYATVKIN